MMTTIAITEERLKEIIREAVHRGSIEAVEEYERTHPEKIKSEERKMIHSMYDIMQEEGANTGTIRSIINLGKSFQDVSRSFIRSGILILTFGIFALVVLFFGKDITLKLFK